MRISAIVAMLTMGVLAGSGTAGADAKKPAGKRIEITVTESGFTPEKVTVKKGEPVTLAFTRKTDKTCAKEVIVRTGEKESVKKELPLDEVVPITVTFAKSGELRYGCGMDMITGVVLVQ